MARVAIIGAGNLGSYLAGTLSTAGHSVYFCVRRAPAAESFPCYLHDPPPADIVLLTVKAYDTVSALPWLAQLCRNGQPVAVIQNGLGHAARVAPYCAIPVLSYVYVEAHGGVHQAFLPQRPPFSVPSDPACDDFAHLFANSPLQVQREADFHTAAWRKMLHNCVSNPLTALARRGLEILKEPHYAQLARAILQEALPIAQQDRASVEMADGEKISEILRSYPPGTRTSMLQDLELGKRLEIDALNGTVIQLGRKYGLPTPVNEEVVKMLAV